jgi:hypothetical protein
MQRGVSFDKETPAVGCGREEDWTSAEREGRAAYFGTCRDGPVIAFVGVRLATQTVKLQSWGQLRRQGPQEKRLPELRGLPCLRDLEPPRT